MSQHARSIVHNGGLCIVRGSCDPSGVVWGGATRMASAAVFMVRQTYACVSLHGRPGQLPEEKTENRRRQQEQTSCSKFVRCSYVLLCVSSAVCCGVWRVTTIRQAGSWHCAHHAVSLVRWCVEGCDPEVPCAVLCGARGGVSTSVFVSDG